MDATAGGPAALAGRAPLMTSPARSPLPTSLLVAILAAPLALACTHAEGHADTGTQESVATAMRTNVSSPHARPGARYLASRPFAALEQVGAFSDVQKAVVARIKNHGQHHLGVDALRFVEDPGASPRSCPRSRPRFRASGSCSRSARSSTSTPIPLSPHSEST